MSITRSISGIPKRAVLVDALGNVNLSGIELAGGIAASQDSFIMGNGALSRLWFLNNEGTDGASLFFNLEHSGSPELQINGPRIALCLEWHGLIQMGLSRGAASTQHVLVQTRGEAEADHPIVKSLPFVFNSRIWDGDESIPGTQPFFIAEPTGTGTDVNLNFYNPGVAPNEAGAFESGTLAMSLTKAGLILPLQTVEDENAAISRKTGDERYSQGKVYYQCLTSPVQAFNQTYVAGPALVLPAGSYDFEIFCLLESASETAGGQSTFQCSPGTDVTTFTENRQNNIPSLGYGWASVDLFRKGTNMLGDWDFTAACYFDAPNNYAASRTRGTTVLASETTVNFRVKQRSAVDAVNAATVAVGSFIKFTKH